MLLSLISLDSNVLPGQVPALPSSRAGATGFAEQMQLVAAMPPPDASAPVSIPLNSGDAAAPAATNTAGPKIPAQPNALPAFASIPPAAPIAFHSTAELNLSGVVFSPIVSGPGPQAAVSSTVTPEAPMTPAPMPTPAPQAPAVAADEIPQTPTPVMNMPAAEVKPQKEIAPVLQDAAPAIEEAPILASGLPQKTSTPKAAAPDAPVEHKHHAHAEKAEPRSGDTPDSQPQAAVTAQPQLPAAPVPAPTPLPVHMVLPIAARFSRPLIPLGNRIPATALVATRTPVRTEGSAAADPSDPFNSDADPKAATLPPEAMKPLVATADQLAFAAKVQLAKPQATQRHAAPVQAEPVHAAPVHTESHSQQQEQSSHGESDQQLSTKAGETTTKPVARAEHSASTFEGAATVSEDHISAAKPGLTASTRPASASAGAEDVTPTRPELPAAPMKDISVRIQSDQGENVDIRILHRAGDVQIAVKSASGETTQGLRHGLSELSDHLNATGYHADTWHPGQTTTAAENNADSGNSQQQQSQGDSQSHSGWSQQQSGQRDDNQNNRPRWIEELDSNISSAPETGLFHGLIR